ncbi:MAG TPA: dipeptidase [Candidatus Hydrogenedens sp.]|nr:dipeptidase [Candidatus Hydrogenedens sp.]
MSNQEKVFFYIDENWNRFIDDLKEFVAIPSISTLPNYKGDVLRTAQWLERYFQRLNFNRVEIIETGGHPFVFAEYKGPNPLLTLLIYGHYDVQPVDPENEWDTKPFQPTIKGDCMYGRGVSDMKAQLLAQMFATQAWLENNSLPIHLKYIIEGEEEIGSPSMQSFLKKYKELLKSDVAINCDAGVFSPDIPSVTYGLRGLTYFELELKGPKQDLHSGLYGGTIRNPIHVLCELIAKMHDEKGKVTLPYFYDKVKPLTDEERSLLSQIPHSDEEWKKTVGMSTLYGEAGYSTIERVGARPTLEINGIIGGFTGEGAKTVLPSKARAKISMRLVPDQEPEKMEEYLREFLQQHCPSEMEWNLSLHSCSPPALMNLKSPYMQSAITALTEEFGRAPLFRREGGSVPVVAWLQQILGLDSIMLGFALPDDGIHGPNEHQNLPLLKKGIRVHCRFYEELLKGKSYEK